MVTKLRGNLEFELTKQNNGRPVEILSQRRVLGISFPVYCGRRVEKETLIQCASHSVLYLFPWRLRTIPDARNGRVGCWYISERQKGRINSP